jgi:hypothetical protein
MGKAGGLLYHWRALQNKKRWAPFREFVEEWLLSWSHPPFSRLVLIGPNAGYTLPTSFVKKFAQVIVVEPDPAAWALFEARFQAGSQLVRVDYFGLKETPPNPEKLRGLFLAFPKSVFLFCNVLGQLPILLREDGVAPEAIELYMQGLGVVLTEMSQGHCIASYHDRFSRDWRKADTVVDHMTGQLFPKSFKRKEFPWHLTKRIEHQIEFVRTDG